MQDAIDPGRHGARRPRVVGRFLGIAMVGLLAIDSVLTPGAKSQEASATGLLERASSTHPGQAYYLYVPMRADPARPLPLLVAVHGSQRAARESALQFAPLAEANGYAVLAPLFPEGIDYQRLGLSQGERLDLLLLDLVEEVAQEVPIETDRFDLFGFSGGGQFAHRFLYLHPGRLRSVAVASPGTVTLPAPEYRWPAGLGGVEELIGAPIDWLAVQGVRVMLLVGAEDQELDGLNRSRTANLAGADRLERARTLHAAWETSGIPHRYLEVPGLGHVLDERILDPVGEFLVE